MDLLPVTFTDYYTKGKVTSIIADQIKERNDPHLYCTYNDVRDVVEDCYKNNVDTWYKTGVSQSIACSLAWSKAKQIYRFNHDLTEVLSEQTLEGDLPVEVLLNLPYKSIYIQTDLMPDLDGFFVYFDRNEYCGDDLELRLFLLGKHQNQTIIPIHLMEGKSLKECLEETYNQSIDWEGKEHLVKKAVEEYYQVAQAMIQMVLYLCSENKDVVEKKRIEFTKRDTNNKKKKKQQQPKPKETKVREWEVGTVITREFKGNLYTPQESTKGTGHGSKKASHMRKAHWHHYWIGSKENKRLVLKWIPPMYINQKTKLIPAATINNVK